MRPSNVTRTGEYTQSIEVNRVLKNTYVLLSLTLLFSAAMAWVAMSTNAQPMGFFVSLVGMFGLLFLTMWLKNSPWGLLSTFAFTGFMGYMLGPMLNFYIKAFSNGSQIVLTSLGCTGLIFLTLSAYTILSKKNFNYLGGFISIAMMVLFVGIIGSFLFNMPILQLVISGGIAVISAAYIMYTTSAIINGGERNYIMATVSLYISIFNLFVSLLRILAAFSGNRS
ncbi:MAG: Bax inhibitor-1/YccA family protein [Gammaproteobacteria bacterium]|nr:Bax inhibitor-1/YccA family protein [Gammaproteobacteria bacterium]MCH9744458.1 Bax inhibitor-1/YccA family protein [Gammaproteobacteria bacterium]